MRVLDHEACLRVPEDLLRVLSRYLDFIYRVDDVFACCFLVQLSPGMLPFVAFVQLERFSLGRIVRIQLHFDRRRADLVFVVAVFPDLLYRDGDFLGFVCIDYIVALDLRCIVCNRFLCYGVFILRLFVQSCTRCIHRKISEAVLPIILFGHGNLINFNRIL